MSLSSDDNILYEYSQIQDQWVNNTFKDKREINRECSYSLNHLTEEPNHVIFGDKYLDNLILLKEQITIFFHLLWSYDL